MMRGVPAGPGDFLNKAGDEVDGQEANEKRAELADEIGADGVLAARESGDADARDVRSRLLITVEELVGVSYLDKLALGGSGAEA